MANGSRITFFANVFPSKPIVRWHTKLIVGTIIGTTLLGGCIKRPSALDLPFPTVEKPKANTTQKSPLDDIDLTKLPQISLDDTQHPITGEIIKGVRTADKESGKYKRINGSNGKGYFSIVQVKINEAAEGHLVVGAFISGPLLHRRDTDPAFMLIRSFSPDENPDTFPIGGKEIGSINLDPLIKLYTKRTGHDIYSIRLVADQGTNKDGQWIGVTVVPVNSPTSPIEIKNLPVLKVVIQNEKVVGSHFILSSAPKKPFSDQFLNSLENDPNLSKFPLAIIDTFQGGICKSFNCHTDPEPLISSDLWQTSITGINARDGILGAFVNIGFDRRFFNFYQNSIDLYLDETYVQSFDLATLGARYKKITGNRLSFVKLVVVQHEYTRGQLTHIFVIPVEKPGAEIDTHTPYLEICYQNKKFFALHGILTE